jgi:hypothetical protein
MVSHFGSACATDGVLKRLFALAPLPLCAFALNLNRTATANFFWFEPRSLTNRAGFDSRHQPH